MTQTLIAVSLQELRALVCEAVRDGLSGPARPAAPKAWLSTTELAKHFYVHPRTVVYWAQKYGCPHFKVGGRWRFVLADVERWHSERIDGRTVPEPPNPNPHSGS